MKGSLMGNIARHTGRWIVILFCLWHITAVFAITVPSPASSPTAVFLREVIHTFTRPYLNWTSQWQSWDLFAPNPSNWITEERIEVKNRDGWETVKIIAPDHVSEWRRADTFKIQQRIENGDSRVERERFLTVYCVEHGVAIGTPVRMILRTQYLSRNDAIPKEGEWSEQESALIFCPARL